MGAVNYCTNEFITLGLPYLSEAESENNLDYVLQYNVNSILNCFNFRYYEVDIAPGYYEGFSLKIENITSVFDDWKDKREAQKELTQLKKCLLECAEVGLRACCPGWCTAFEDYEGTIKAIKEAIKNMRADIKGIPTWYQDCIA